MPAMNIAFDALFKINKKIKYVKEYEKFTFTNMKLFRRYKDKPRAIPRR
jgi:hypothetical protein